MHISCLRHEADRKCADCKTEFPFKSLVNLKRPHREDGDQDHSLIDEDEEVKEKEAKRRKLNEEVTQKRSVFPSLKSDETALNLDKFIKDHKAK
jgi:hypothetical protein